MSDYNNKAGNAVAAINVTDDRLDTALTASNPTLYLQAIAKGSSYQITLKDANGKVISGKEIIVDFNGQTLKASTNDKGIATLTLKASKTGSLKATISFAGDNAYKASTKTATIKVTKEAAKITAKKKTFKVKKSKKYSITLKSKSGKAISKAKVILKVKGKKYTAKTNAKGKATFNLKKLTKKGKHTATITFAGDKFFNKATKKVKLTVKK
ncbi:MAG: invasin domain 3-containing protein [Methanobrevibacter sp.]|nr:invasin domain 3-containing protein [Methanobrevibacter sp.]